MTQVLLQLDPGTCKVRRCLLEGHLCPALSAEGVARHAVAFNDNRHSVTFGRISPGRGMYYSASPVSPLFLSWRNTQKPEFVRAVSTWL